MDTNYGARPGLSDAAGKFSGSDLMAIGERIVAANERARKAEAELDAERAAHGETVASLDKARESHAATLAALSVLLAESPDCWVVGGCVPAGSCPTCAARAALAQARGSRGAK